MIKYIITLMLCASPLMAADVLLGNITNLTWGGSGTERVAVWSAAPATIPQFDNSITWYRFNEFTNTAGKHVDSSAVGTNTAIPQAGAASPTWISPSLGIYLDGGDYSSQDCGYILNGLSAVTYSIWISNQVWSAYDGILLARGATTHGLALDSANTDILAYADAVRSYALARADVAFTNSAWTHICMTWTNNAYPKVYINGILKANIAQALATNLVISGQTGVIAIGNDTGAGGRNFTGNIDDPLIYKTALSSNEVFQLYNFGH
jgi:hypothetical protein